MIHPFDSTGFRNKEYDLCVIGAGAMGLCLLEEFDGTPLRVLCLAGGDVKHSQFWDKFNDCHINGLPHEGVGYARPRVAGGATTIWGGQALPFQPIDFEARDWVRLPGWPIALEEVTPYYERARRFMGLPADRHPEVHERIRKEVAEKMSPRFEVMASEWTTEPDLFKVKRKRIAASSNIDFLTGCQASHLLPAAKNGRNGVLITCPGKPPVTIFPDRIILAAGAIENARLLLETERNSGGTLFRSPFVGRCFQEHPASSYARLRPKAPLRISQCFGKYYLSDCKIMPKLRFPEERQREAKVLNAACHLIPEDSNLVCRGKGGRLMKLAASLPHAVRYVSNRLLRGREYWGSRTFIVELHVEQEPDESSRVLLGEKVLDGNFKEPVLDWRVSDLTLRTIRSAGEYFVSLLRSEGVGECELLIGDGSDEALKKSVRDVYHMIGTTRMGADSATGVVDADCEVYDLPGVHVAGASVFPTGSFSNPTLTALALSMRLAERLKRLSAA